MDKNTPMIIGGIIILAVIVGGVVVFGTMTKEAPAPGELDSFAQCINDSGTTFFGAFWCPHCQAQKALFGNSAKLLPYVECSTPDGQGQLQVCREAGVQSYPTWEFPDGSRLSGEVPLQQLSEKTGCMLPGSEGGAAPELPETAAPGESSSAVE